MPLLLFLFADKGCSKTESIKSPAKERTSSWRQTLTTLIVHPLSFNKVVFWCQTCVSHYQGIVYQARVT